MFPRSRKMMFSFVKIINRAKCFNYTVFRLGSSYCQRRSHNCGELREENVGHKVSLCGWLQYKRLNFLTLRDAYGVTQIIISEPKDKDVIQSLLTESVVQVIGTVESRPESQFNPEMPTGSIEVKASEIKVLNSCRKDLPFHIHDRHQVNENLRMEYRYLDIRNTTLQRNLRLRSRLIMKMRDFLCNQNGFVDVETPTLFRKTPGGAREFKVATHLPGKFYSLPQSPQQFKQLLMVGCLDRYMQIAKCYRDEVGNPERQPEFTQMDLEMSFVNKEDIQNLVEELLRFSWPDDRPQLDTPFPRMKYHDAIAHYGSDKPDTRFDMKLCDVSDLVKDCRIENVSTAASQTATCSVQSVNFKGASSQLSNKEVESINTKLKQLGTDVWLAVVRVKDDAEWQGGLRRQFGEDVYRLLCDRLNTQPGDLIVITAGKHTNACTCAGRFRTEVANSLEMKGHNVRGDKKKMNFLWVEDFPLFLPKEDGSDGLESAHHPFTAAYPGEEELIYSIPEQVRSQHYDLVLNGNEIGGGSIRIHNSKLQRYILTDILKEDSSSLEHLLTALEFGCPPHGGIALGLDRLIAILCNASSIKEVIAFPKTTDGKDLMAKAPASISEEDRNYYHL